MNQTSFSDHFSQLWQQTTKHGQAFAHHLQLAQHYAQKINQNSSGEDPFARLRAAMLQLRLDNADVIRALLTFHRSFCNALGIDAQHSVLDNLAQIQYLIGDETIQSDLSLLGHMLSDLERVYDVSHKNYLQQLEQQRLQKQLLQKILQQLAHGEQNEEWLASFVDLMHDVEYEAYRARTERYRAKQSTHFIDRYYFNFEHELMSAAELQALFQYSLEQLTEALQVYEGDFKLSAAEYDHLASLRGPIDKFYTAMRNGVIVLRDLFVFFFGNHTLQAPQAKTILQTKSNQLQRQIQQLMNLQQQNIQHQQQYQQVLNQQFSNLRQQQLNRLPPAATLPVAHAVKAKQHVVKPARQTQTASQQQQQSLKPPLKNPSAMDFSYTSSLRRGLSMY